MKFLLCVFSAILSFFCTPNGAVRESRKVPVIMYHSVCKTNVGEYVISPARLEQDFAYLRDKGYTAVFVRDIIDYCDGKADLPPKPIVLTFDDGFYNNLFYAEKLAEKYDMKMVVSVVGAYSQKEEGESKRSPVYSYLNTSEISALYKSGRAELCNHTFDMHSASGGRKGVRRKRNESVQEYARVLKQDSEKCRTLLQACGCTVNVFTYPFGCYSAETNDILRSLGYRAVLTCKGGINTFYKGSKEGLFGIMRYNRSGTLTTRDFFTRVCRL